MSRGGVYVYRARKPSARLRIPLLSWHTAYVGETTSFYHRHLQHVGGWGTVESGGRKRVGAVTPQPWSDLDPYVWFRIPLPRWKWLLRSVETLAILLLWPVYNHKKNLWNPRRIPLHVAKSQRAMRDRRGWSPSWTWGHTIVVLAAGVALWLVTR